MNKHSQNRQKLKENCFKISKSEYNATIDEANKWLELSIPTTKCLEKYLDWLLREENCEYLEKIYLIGEIKKRKESEKYYKKLANTKKI